MKVKFLKLRENTKLPTKAHDDDFCYDVYKYKLGFALQIDENEGVKLPDKSFATFSPIKSYHNTILSIDFRPRSSVWKTGMVLSNATGTVDVGYTGEICAIFYHVMPNMPKYEVGDRVAQMKIGITVPIEFVEVNELNKTERSDNGFGSSGKN